MKKLMILACLLVTGCVNPAQQRVDLETSAWNTASARVDAECVGEGKTFAQAIETLKRGQAVKLASCGQKITNEVVAPVAVFPDLFYANRAEAIAAAEDFDAGKISRERYVAEGQARGAAYYAQINERLMAQDLQNRQLAAQRAAVYNSITQTMNQQQMINSMNAPRQTNCQRFGNQVNCTTY